MTLATCDAATIRVNGTPRTEALLRAARDRLYPSITDPNWLVLRSRREIFRQWLQEIVDGPVSVLDIGGRIQPYRSLLPAEPLRYTAVDLLAVPPVDISVNAEQLPMCDNSFDLVLCTQMLEYAPEPAKVIAEIYRVLKPGGHLLLSVPSIALRDSDQDCWRFWPAALRHLLRNFSNSTMVPETGSIAGLVRSINAGVTALMKYRSMRALTRMSVVPVLNLAAIALQKTFPSDNDIFAVNYSVRARK